MDINTFAAMAVACAPLVHPSTAQALVSVESAFNPFAIGVVGGSLVRQPRTRDEALTAAKQLQADSWNFSIGLAQINVHNLQRLGLTLAEAFEPCANLRAMQAVLVECIDRSTAGAEPQAALRQALSCYYSGNFVTGFRHGYVRRVVQAAHAGRPTSGVPP